MSDNRLVPPLSSTIQARLLRWAGVFLFLYSLILTLSPAVREHTFAVHYRWSHWLGFFLWVIIFFTLHRFTVAQLPESDPYLLPATALLSGWGLLTIWRLDSTFGMRQLLWLLIGAAIWLVGLRLPRHLLFLRRYKYLLLTSGLLLTALTLIAGTNPAGQGPRLWLGCCGFYLQPSEPLKLLLVIYLSAYLADRLSLQQRIFPLLFPTLFTTGLALLLLLVQRDLGTASIFILIYATMLYLASEHKRVLLFAALGLILAGGIGYLFIGIVQQRISVWINPWADPSGSAYQIIQSLLAIANGGIIGRGPGIGNPAFVPVAISDFIFAAIAEETGLLGTFGLICLFGLILARGLRASLRAPDRFHRFLAAGLTAYLGIQSVLIVGGNLRLLPLTGVTLPFVSYGGSSLLTSFVATLLLLLIGQHDEEEPAALPSAQPYMLLNTLLTLALLSLAIATTWWAVIRSPALLSRTDNPRRALADRFVRRGSLLARDNTPLQVSEGESGSYHRVYLYPPLGPVTGYTHPVFGQAGLEASLDDYLRGLQGYPLSVIWWNQLLYGTPPPGLDVRLSLDLQLQNQADLLLGTHAGAVILLNAQSGEILAMASHPAFDPNRIEEESAALLQRADTPLLNRATQGAYPPGTATAPFLSLVNTSGTVTPTEIQNLFDRLGFYTVPRLRMPVAVTADGKGNTLRISPLQMALASAALSNHGLRPAPRIAIAVNTPQQGWVILPALDQPVEAVSAAMADRSAQSFAAEGKPYWEYTAQAGEETSIVTWYLGGTLPDWQGTPLAIVVTLEEDNPSLAKLVGRKLLESAQSH